MKSTKIQIFVFSIILAILLIVGCQKQDPPHPVTVAPANTAAPSPAPPATAMPTQAATPSPAPTIPDAPFTEALNALEKISSLQINSVGRDLFTGEEKESTSQYTLNQPEQSRITTTYSTGVSEETICIDSMPKGQCWARVGQHPWSAPYLNYGLLRTLQTYWEDRTIVATEYLLESNEILVRWDSPAYPGQSYSAEISNSGSTWLQPETYLPLREISEDYTLDGTLIRTNADTYTYEEHNTPFVIEPPEMTTVAPIPSPEIPDPPTLSVHSEQAPFLVRIYTPDEEGEYPGVIVLHGSGGANAGTSQTAKWLAQNGYVTLSLCYFGCPDRPDRLREINLEYIMEAITYLQERDDVQDDAIAVVGFSRGAELALIMGVIDPHIKAVVSVMGSHRVVGAIPLPGPAWLYRDKPLPFEFIPAEQINGPVMIMHGEQDTLWSVFQSYYLADRLEANNHEYELLIFPDRGHELNRKSDMQHVHNFLQEALP